jgi:excinuclease ABC subunit A
MDKEIIAIRGARQHNLDNIDIDLPRNRFIVVTGLSGSGKSTLAFDTLYAEGQRRYVESLSTYARQFLGRMDKPDVDAIEGLSPAIAIEQKTASQNPRSTVGTVTEIHDYLRLLYARVGVPHCHVCGRPITSQSIDQIVDGVMSFPEKTRLIILAPLVSGQKGTFEALFKRLRKDGFARVRVDGEIRDLDEEGKLAKNKKHDIEVVVDRVVVKESVKNRLADSLELALSLSDGVAAVQPVDGKPILFSERAACLRCGVSYGEFTPAAFSFNSPRGACPKCDGLGATMEIDPSLVVPDPERSLREGAVVPWATRNSVHFADFLDALTGHFGVDIHTPYKDLPVRFQNALLYGTGRETVRFYYEQQTRRVTFEKPFEGVIPNLERRYLETDSSAMREEIRRFMTTRKCPECGGAKLKAESRAVTVGEKGIHEVSALSVTGAETFFSKLTLEGKARLIARGILKEIRDRLAFLSNLGLGYLTLDRPAYTLSGGESQRIRLATQVGSKLTGVLYVLDEPSIGLHQKDNRKLLNTLMAMRDSGNTVLVVEHDEETILSADHVVDMGPGAGVCGGRIVFSGPPRALLTDKSSLTGRYFSGRLQIEIPRARRPGNGKRLVLKGARENNLAGVEAAVPLGAFTCVTGVSGSGKSTLVLETLYRALARKLYGARTLPGAHDAVTGIEYIDKAVHIDQSPIGRTPRSNPGTYTGLFTHIRELFAHTPDAKARGYKPGRFSFNVKGGRCESCEGDGIIKIEMHFLPDVYVTCDVCRGKRYNRETLEIRYKGKNIIDVLEMTVDEALSFFKNVASIRSKLQTLADVGLGYIHIGQQATTLSGGEAQRVKLSRELSKKATGKTIYFLDEPTTGLHVDDVRKLLGVLNRLTDMGNTVIVIEHNLDVIKSADHIIDMGPEGGDAGGRIVCSGPPEAVAENPSSHTGRYLKPVLEKEAAASNGAPMKPARKRSAR